MTKLAHHWTSSEPRLGFRHFRVVGEGGRGKDRWVELVALLDPTKRFRLPCRDLGDPASWSSGLLPVVEEILLEPVLDTQGPKQEPSSW